MRFFEIASPRAKIVATKRFMKNAAVYLRGGYKGLDKVFRDFLEFKSENPTTPYGVKDTPFGGGNKALQGIWHCHLIHGKVIVIYKAVGSEVQLYDMVEHTAVEGGSKQTNSISDYIASLGSSDFTPVAVQDHSAPAALSADTKRELDDLMYEMAAQDRDILLSAARGDFVDLMEFMRLAAPDVSDDAIIAAYGGAQGLQAHIRQVMKQMGVA